MLQKTVYIFLIQFILLNSSYSEELDQIGLHLPKSEWIGLGFYLAPLADKSNTTFYENCFEDKAYFMQADSQKLSNTLFTAVAWLKNGGLHLRSLSGKKLFCKVDQEGYFPELVFFKDLEDTKEKFKGKIIWSRKHFFNSQDARGNIVRYPLPKFSGLLVKDVVLAPVSQDVSIRFILETEYGYPGHLDINYTAVNRKPPYDAMNRYFFTDHPRKTYSISKDDWALILNSETRPGMTMQEVQLSIGKPVDQFSRGKEVVLVYPERGNIDHHYIFMDNRLVARRKSGGDDF